MNENIIAGDKTAKPKYTYSLNSDDKNLIIGLVTDNSETLTVTADYYGITVNDLCKNDDGILFGDVAKGLKLIAKGDIIK